MVKMTSDAWRVLQIIYWELCVEIGFIKVCDWSALSPVGSWLRIEVAKQDKFAWTDSVVRCERTLSWKTMFPKNSYTKLFSQLCWAGLCSEGRKGGLFIFLIEKQLAYMIS